MLYGGIDPGKSGAAVLLEEDGRLAGWFDQPVIVSTVPSRKNKTGKKVRTDFDVPRMIEVVQRMIEVAGDGGLSVALEWPGARPGEGAVGAVSLGDARSLWRGILASHRVPHVRIHPATWQTALRGAPGGNAKERALLAAQAQWPALPLLRKKDHDRAQAAWIAERHRRDCNGGEG